MADKSVYKVQRAIIEIELPYYTEKTKALCFDIEYNLVIGNIPRWKQFCAKDKLDEKTSMIAGDNQETNKISKESSIDTKPIDSINGIHHLEMNVKKIYMKRISQLRSNLNWMRSD